MASAVLVVDDDPELREAIAASLIEAGYSPYTVADGRSAMQALTERSFDAVCLDVILPDVSGYEVCEWLRARAAGATTLVVMTSGRASPIDQATALECGADHFLPKPFDVPELIALLRTSVRQAVCDAVA
jgi:DNA-binding response OmpR family regulator